MVRYGGVFSSHSRNRLFLDFFLLVIVYRSLYKFNRGYRVIYSSRLIRLLARDGEYNVIQSSILFP